MGMSTAAAPAAPVEKFRKDYKSTDYSVTNLDLTFKIADESTQVEHVAAPASEPGLLHQRVLWHPQCHVQHQQIMLKPCSRLTLPPCFLKRWCQT
jgi:hypothetical protein